MTDPTSHDARPEDSTAGDVPTSNWGPTRTATAVAVLVTLAVVVTAATSLGLVVPVTAGAVGACCFAATLWLVRVERYRTVATLLASGLLLPVGTGIGVAVGYAALVWIDALFPVPAPEQAVGPILRVAGTVAVVVGTTVATFGAATAVRDVVEGERVSRVLSLSVRVALVPAGLCTLLAARAVLANYGTITEETEAAVSLVVDAAVTVVVSPPAGRIHPVSFLALLAIAAWTARWALTALPVRELLAARVEDRDVGAALDGVDRWLGRTAVAAAVGFPLAIVAVLVVGQPPGSGVAGLGYDLVATLTASGALRVLLTGVAVVSLLALGVAGTVRALAQASVRELGIGSVPVLAGVPVAAAAFVVHGSVVPPLRTWVVDHLPAPFGPNFEELSAGVVEFYGEPTVTLVLIAVVVALTALVVLVVLLADRVGSLPERAAGASLASTGLFFTAAFGATVGLSAPLVFAGLAASLVAWDLGEFGVTLGREVGRRAATVRAELVHASGTLVVGAAAAMAATVLLGAVSAAAPAPDVPASLALAAALVGTVLFVVAVR